MKIVYIHQYFVTPEMAGGTRSYEMARRWVQAGHEVHMITSRRDRAIGRRGWRVTREAGIVVHWCGVPYENGMESSKRIRAFLTFALLAGPRARAIGADVVFATSTPLTVIVPALVALWRRGTPLVFEVRDLWPEMPIAVGALHNPGLVSLARWLELLAYRKATRIVALSDGIAAGVIARGIRPAKVIVATNACDIDRFACPPSIGKKYRADNGWLHDRKLATYCGTVGEINDVSYIVRLAACVSQIDSTIVFAICGDGKCSTEVRRLAEALHVLDSNLYMLGELNKSAVPALLSASTVAMSVFQPIPEMEANSANKFFDALASGRPVAINYGGWQAHLITREGIGIVLSPSDVEEAASQLVGFMRDDWRLASARQAAGRLARDRFSRDEVSSVVLRAIGDAVRARR